nr:TolB-like protein [Lysobacter terrigena]
MRTVHHRSRGVAVALAMLFAATPCTAFAPWGMEGVGTVSTRDTEIRATVSPDGQTIVWGSPDRAGASGGWDLWRAHRIDGRWQNAEPLALNTPAKEFDPMFSGDGRWLYFFSNRAGGQGGDDLYRAPVAADGAIGAAKNLGPGVNTRGDEWAPTPSRDGRRLLFASDGQRGARRHDLFVATWNGTAFVDAKAVPGIATDADEFDGAWIGDGDGLVFARSTDVESKPIRLYVATCRAKAYGDAVPMAVAFNTEEAWTLGPAVDWNRPVEMLITGAAPSPKAGKLDIYRVLTPVVRGDGSCG